jgi:hypothetical protein
MANKYHIYVGGTFDEKAGGYRGGTLDATFTNEREAFFHEKKLQWKFKKGIHMEVEGDERFTIVPCNYNGLTHLVVDKRTQTKVVSACTSLEDAIEAKAWDEKYHYEGGKWMDEYYKQFQAA